MSNMNYPPACPHDDIQEVFKDVFWVHGSIRVGPGMRMNRNMVIIREGEKLLIINPVRLSVETENELRKLGVVSWVMRLGDFHGIDDQYYIDKFGALLTESTALPVSGMKFIAYESALYPEGVLYLPDHSLLITCDSIQYHMDWSYTSNFTRIVLKLMGFRLGLFIGKPWLKRVTSKGANLVTDFERILSLNFNNLIAAHGGVLKNDAQGKLNGSQ